MPAIHVSRIKFVSSQYEIQSHRNKKKTQQNQRNKGRLGMLMIIIIY